MRNLKITLTLFILVIANQSYSQIVDPELAKTIAFNFFSQQSSSSMKTTAVASSDVKIEKIVYSDYIEAKGPLCYIVSFDNNVGFVILSGNEKVKPILAYSTENNFNHDNQNPGLKYWLGMLDYHYTYLINNNIQSKIGVKTSWEYLKKGINNTKSSKLKSSNGYLLGNIEWGQGEPLNQVMFFEHFVNIPMGCVAVAMGQIMKYYNFPIKGIGSHTYNEPLNYDEDKPDCNMASLGELSADFSSTYYNWPEMPGFIDVQGGLSQATENISMLLYHIGIAVETNYNQCGSGSNIIKATNAFKDHFDYPYVWTRDAAQAINTSDWYRVINENIDNKTPLFYAGVDKSEESAHAFVIDGYDENDLYHVNWGWFGGENGYFDLSILYTYRNPPIEPEIPERRYSDDQQVIFSITPNTNDPAQDIYEPDPTPTEASEIESEEPQLRSIHQSGELDYIYFEISSQSAVSIQTKGVLGDPKLTLYNQIYQVIAQDNNSSGYGNNALIAMDLPAGKYYVLAQSTELLEVIPSYILDFTAVPLSGPTEPILSNFGVSPQTGTSTTQFDFTVHYYDANGDVPMQNSAEVKIEGIGTYNLSLNSGTASNGTYGYERNLPIGNYRFKFMFLNTANEHVETNYINGPVVTQQIDYRMQDSLALVALYHATGGPNWTRKDNWLTGSIADWYGITVKNGRVSEIGLLNNNLSGNIPLEIGNISYLQRLNLYGNNLTGAIPDELYSLNYLETLWLANNEFSGPIPKEIGSLDNLVKLSLGENNFTGQIPQEIFGLIKLERLFLYSCQLTGPIPVETGNLKEMKMLFLYDNELSGSIPSQIGLLSKLEDLYLHSNYLSGSIPNNLGYLSNLEGLWLSNNQLTGSIPESFGQLSNLYELSLYANQLTGTIPFGIGNLDNLTNLYLHHNDLTGHLPSSFNSMNSLNKLYVSFNKFNFLNISNCGILDGDINDFYYSPQAKLPSPTQTSDDNIIILSLPVGHNNNVYKWYKNNNVIENENTNQLAIASNENGLFYCQITNSLYPELSLVTEELEIGNPYLMTEVDSLALVALYNSTGGPNWTHKDNWLVGRLENWYGVTVENGRVVKLDLGTYTDGNSTIYWPGNNLIGEIPEDLWNLTELKHLDLSSNNLSGHISSEIGNLNKLEVLYLCFTSLNGELPPEIGSLENIEEILLYNNEFNGDIPASIGDLEMLRELLLDNNQLSGTIPIEITSLKNLEVLSLCYNQLTGPIPSELGSLSSLSRLYLISNQLTGSIPAELGNLSNLNSLNLSLNQLTGQIPIELGKLSNLTKLYLSSNQLTGPIPAELGSLNNLKHLYLSSNQLTGAIPEELGALSNLYWLHLSGNQLSGPLPNEWGDLNNLESFYIHVNKFTFSDIANSGIVDGDIDHFYYSPQAELPVADISEDNSNVTLSLPVSLQDNIYQWYKDGNLLESEVSRIFVTSKYNSGFYKCKVSNPNYPALVLITAEIEINNTPPTNINDSLSLVTFYDSTGGSNWTHNDNWLTTSPLKDWYGVTIDNGRVIKLELPDNNFIGQLPKELSNLSNLTTLNLHGIWEDRGKFSGSIPEEFGQLKELEVLLLAGNELTGVIPEELGLLTKLSHLYLGSNNLEDSIPESFRNLVNLTHFRLDDNSISGQIPNFIGSFDKLEYLDLSENQLSGSIPSELGQLTNLGYMDLSSNQLSGLIPEEFGNLQILWKLNLSENQLSGSIPKELGNLRELDDLFLSSNQLSGSIPKEIGNMSKLSDLWLQNNQLTGEIPIELGNLSNLWRLLLYHNQLTGPFPTELCYLPELSTVKLFCNSLSGTIPEEIKNLTRLWEFNLGVNEFSGSIPKGFGDLQRLHYLYLNENQLTGLIPEDLGGSVEIRSIYLYDNQLTGPIPKEVGDWINMENFYINNNLFVDSIPDELNKLINLKSIRLENNKFNYLPNLSSLSNLEVFKVMNNDFNFLNIYNSGLTDDAVADFVYAPQAKLQAPEKSQDTNIPWNYTLSVPEGHENNVYHWYRNATIINGENARQCVLQDFEGGTYYCTITNSLYPQLTLETEIIEVQNTVGIDESSNSKNLKIYPNPTNDKLSIEITDCQNEQYIFEIYNLNGKKLSAFEEQITSNVYTTKIDCSNLASGNYILKIISENGSYTKMFTVMH